MRVNEVVFAPLKEKMWPGRILSLKGGMAEIKHFKIKDKKKASLKSLVPFTQSNIDIFHDKYRSKQVSSAIKAAEKDLLDKKKKGLNLPDEEEEEDRLKVNIKQEEIHGIKEEEMVCIKAEEDDHEANLRSIPSANCLLRFLLGADEKSIFRAAARKGNFEVLFFNTRKQEKCHCFINAETVLIILTEFLLSRLLCEKDKKIISQYQKKATSILSQIKFSTKTLLKSNILKNIKIMIQYRENDVIPWIPITFVSQLKKIQENARKQLSYYLTDYSDTNEANELISGYKFSAE